MANRDESAPLKMVRTLYQDGKRIDRREDVLEPGKALISSEQEFTVDAGGAKAELRMVVGFDPPLPIVKPEGADGG